MNDRGRNRMSHRSVTARSALILAGFFLPLTACAVASNPSPSSSRIPAVT